jgi:Uma2 family endonuclease
MGWLIDPGDRSVVVSGAGYSAEVVDDPGAILPVPVFAKSLQISIEQMFGWLNLV